MKSTDEIKLRQYGNAREYWESFPSDGYTLSVFEYQLQEALGASVRAEQQLELVEKASDFLSTKKRLSLFVILVEQFAGDNKESSFARQVARLSQSQIDFIQKRDNEKNKPHLIGYCLKFDRDSIVEIKKANIAFGVITEEGKCSSNYFSSLLDIDFEKYWPVNMVRSTTFLEEFELIANLNTTNLEGFFCFSGEFDDMWNELCVFGVPPAIMESSS